MSHSRHRGRSGLLPIVVALVAAMVGVGCGSPAPQTGEPPKPPTPTPAMGSVAASPATDPSPSAERPTASVPIGSPGTGSSGDLLLLAGQPGVMVLELVSADGHRRGLPLPDPDVAWISTDATGRALITTRAGRAFLSGPITRLGTPAWRNLQVTASGAAPGPMSFGTLSPDGSRAAFVAADFATTRGFELVIVDTVGATARIQVPRPAEGAPPSWVDVRLLVLTRERGDAAGVTLLDPADGSLATGPGPANESGTPPPSGAWTGRIAALSISADCSTVAVAAADDDRIEIGPAMPWLAGTAAELASVQLAPGPDGSRSFAWLTLAADGGRLAIVRTNADGDATGVSVYGALSGWQAQTQMALPSGANRAVVAWLP